MRAEFWTARLEALRDCAAKGLSPSATAEHLNISRGTVLNYARKYGLIFKSGFSLTTETRIAALRDFASRGVSQKQAAEELGLSHPTVSQIAARHRIVFVHGNLNRFDVPRAAQMASLYSEGYTLIQIGEQFGITRERVRQIITKRHGMTALSGGAYAKAKAIKERRQARLEAKCQAKNGCSLAQLKHLHDLGMAMREAGAKYGRTPVGAFVSQRNNARTRGVEWQITLWQWWTIWQMSGHWDQRGRGQSYMMCRKGDTGPYAIGNVVIATGIFNGTIQPNNPYRKEHPDFQEARQRLVLNRKAGPHNGTSNHTVHAGLPRGVTLHRGAFQAQITLDGRNKYLGRFPTPELAHAAYLNAGAA